ncbi:DUF4124 domain-containing protein [Marinobacter apostichopi]|uniref:DUF4124 domain-containing protein n=1 Tax=Marinobacter apostichopi TaxID=3035454 RepID=UPI0025729FC1|nr:DUF4124 domain-containing protein [Marinobacter sp. LA51]
MPWILAIFVVIGGVSSPLYAGVYTWIDPNGVAHFSDYPPGELPHREVILSEPSTVPMSENLDQGRRVSGIRDDVRGLLSTPDRGVSRGGGAKGKALARRNKACEAYRKKLDRIQSKLRAGYGNDKGNTLRRQRRETSQKLSRECLLQ